MIKIKNIISIKILVLFLFIIIIIIFFIIVIILFFSSSFFFTWTKEIREKKKIIIKVTKKRKLDLINVYVQDQITKLTDILGVLLTVNKYTYGEVGSKWGIIVPSVCLSVSRWEGDVCLRWRGG